MNELCELKGHMWYANKREDIERKGETWSIAVEIRCSRCGLLIKRPKTIIKYTIGILFDKDLKSIILILKNRPEWQAGKYNFPGGHIEIGETSVACITREVKEECGINIPEKIWKYIGIIKNEGFYSVDIFTSIYIPEKHFQIRSVEDQLVKIINIKYLPKNIISNVLWLTYFAVNYWRQGNIDNLNFGKFYYKY